MVYYLQGIAKCPECIIFTAILLQKTGIKSKKPKKKHFSLKKMNKVCSENKRTSFFKILLLILQTIIRPSKLNVPLFPPPFAVSSHDRLQS